MTLEYLDILLKLLYDNRKEFDELILFDNIHKEYGLQKNISKKELLILLYKLVDDKYVTKKIMTETQNKIDFKPIPTFYISFDGILFYESAIGKFEGKPYQQQRELKRISERDIKIENLPKRFWWLIAIFTWVIGLLTDVIRHKYIEVNPPKSNQLQQDTLIKSDTVLSHKTALFRND